MTSGDSPIIVCKALTFSNHLAFHSWNVRHLDVRRPRHGQVPCYGDGLVTLNGLFLAFLAPDLQGSKDPKHDRTGDELDLVGFGSWLPNL